MANKFNRNYKLTIQDTAQPATYYEPSLVNDSAIRLKPAGKDVVNDKPKLQAGKNAIEIKIPFTIEIDVTNIIAYDGNKATIKVYGLNETSRERLRKSRFNTPVLEDGSKGFRRVILEAGYETNLYPLFVGTLVEGYSIREGVEWVTILSCISSSQGLYNTWVNKAYSSGTKQLEVVNNIITQMSEYKDLEKGIVTPTLNEEFKSSVSLIGESYNILNQYEIDLFVDLGKINVLRTYEAIGKLGLKIPTINADTGLLSTPIFSEGAFIVNMMFEPTIKLGALINLESLTASVFNGYYKVMSIEHRGVISSTKEGPLITTLKLWNGGSLVNNFKLVS